MNATRSTSLDSLLLSCCVAAAVAAAAAAALLPISQANHWHHGLVDQTDSHPIVPPKIDRGDLRRRKIHWTDYF